MKNFYLLLVTILLLAVQLIQSCKEEDKPTSDFPPSISFVPCFDCIINDTILTPQSEFNVNIMGQVNGTTGSNIQSLIITRISNDQILSIDSLFYDHLLFIYEASFVALPDTGVERIEFKVIDKAGQTAMIDLQITTYSAPPPTPVNPTINFVAGPGLISNDAILTVNTPFAIKILAQANATSGVQLESLKISCTFSTTYWDTILIIHESTISMETNFIAQPSLGTETIEFKVTDIDGQSATIDLQITTEPDNKPISTYTGLILHSNNSATPSSFASVDGNVFNHAEAYANQSIIDFFYWYGVWDHATFGAPDDPVTQTYIVGVHGLQNWTIKNSTRFIATSLSAVEFDAITDKEELVANASGATLSRISDMEEGDVVGFVTVNWKFGLIKIVHIYNGQAGNITFDVKVQQ